MNTKSYSPFLVGTMRGPWPLIRGGRLFAQFAVHTTAGWRYFEDRVESEARRQAEEFQKSLNPEPSTMKIEPTNLKGRADERATFKLPPYQPWRFVAYDALPGGSVRLGTVTARTEEDALFKVYSYFEGGSFHPQGRHHPNPVRVWPASEELVIS